MNPPKLDAERLAWVPYVAPLAAFLLLTAVEDAAAKAAHHPLGYPIAYAVKIALVAIVAVLCRKAWRDLRPGPGPLTAVVAIALGLLVTLAWVGLDGRYPPLDFLGKRGGYEPRDLDPTARALFLGVRFFGLVLVVPLIEELFWRSFAMRWLIDPEFTKVPIGKVTPIAAAMTALGFAMGHPEWLPALLTGFAWAGLLAWSKSVSACVLSHAVANLALGIYVLVTGAWRFL